MDDTAKLVSELHDKLAELDGKVAAYQRDMLAQFRRHMDDCLKQYPAHVSDEVSRVIAASMSKYPALSPNRCDCGDLSPRSDGHDDAERKAWDGRKSPPPILYHTSGTPKEGPRSSHEREKEFQGLFTPSYLPLLDSSYCTPQSPPLSPPPVNPAFTLSLDAVKKVEYPKQPETAADGEARPGPARCLTDRSSSSVESSGSEAKIRRSALRRASSSTKGSPRHVRFDFEGEEVLPSTSPQASVTDLTLAGGAEAEQPPPQPQPEREAAATDSSAVITEGDESPSYSGGMSLLDVEGEEDMLPRPRKVSSTQALQALSRSPLDAGTAWTVVNPDPEETPKTNWKETEAAKKADIPEGPLASAPAKMKPDAVVLPQSTVVDNHRIDELLGSPIEELEEYHNEDASDEEFLSMSTKLSRKTPSPVAPVPFGQVPLSNGGTSADRKAAGKPMSIPDRTRKLLVSESTTPAQQEEFEDDPMFDLDEEAGDGKTDKYLADEVDEDETPISEHRDLGLEPTANQSTPPLESDDDPNTAALPPVSPSAALFGHSVGSYMGNLIKGNPINDARLYDQIADMKDIHFIIGSIDGRTGIDPADMGSYRATLARHVAGATPRSFTERLALEEAMETRARGDED